MVMKSEVSRPATIVTGGSRGIGRAIVEYLVERGHKVAFTYHSNEKAAAALVTDLGKDNVMAARVTVEDPAAATEFVRQAVAWAGGLSGLVSNAGITRDRLFAMMRTGDWRQVLDVNLVGSLNIVHPAVRQMIRRRRGSIVLVASVAATRGNPGQAVYAASKGGLLSFVQTMAREIGPLGIRINAVVPGLISTDMTASMPPAPKKAMLALCPLGRIGAPSEVADPVEFLLSARASYVTGSALVVDGGLT